MSQFGVRTIYAQDDLERVSKAPGRIVGLCSNFEPLKGGTAAADKLDSGLGGDEELMGDGPPAPPKLMVDPEQQDSGLGREAETDSEDEVEKDHVAVETRAPTAVTSPKRPPFRTVDKQAPRRPRKNITPSRGSSMQYSTPAQPSVASVSRTDPSQAEEEVQRMRLLDQWRLIQFQRQLNYLLPNKDGDTGIHLAVIHSRPDVLDQLLLLVTSDSRLSGALEEQNGLYQTALHIATHTQQTDMMQKLLAAGASLELTDHKGNTPLHIACKFSSTKCLDEILRCVPLEKVVHCSLIRNHQGQTCVHLATEHGNTDTLRKLKSIGVDMNVEDFCSGKTPLHLAVEKCSLTDVQFLTETCQVDLNKPTYSGCTPLHIAAGRGNIAVVAYLLSMGADPDLQTDEGDNALDLAGSDQVATILTKAAALRWL